MTLIGIEEHWTFDRIDAALRALGSGAGDDSLVLNEHGEVTERLRDVGSLRTTAMLEQGVDMQILSLAPPGTQGLTAADSVGLCRDANDLVAQADPAHFRAMATLPLANPAAAAAELERAASLGLTGAMVYGRIGEVLLDDPRFDDLWSTAARLGQPIFIHPQIPNDSIRDATYRGLGEFASTHHDAVLGFVDH